MFVSVEAFFWLFISFVALFSEIKYISTTNIQDFVSDLERDWYFRKISERSLDSFDEQARSEFCTETFVTSTAK